MRLSSKAGWIALSFMSLIVGGAARGQVIYEPVRYQYGVEQTFYYGGSDARVFERAAAAAGSGRRGVEPWSGRFGLSLLQTGLASRPPSIYSDRFPFENAAIYGYTPSLARDEANANVPRYFRKADLLRSAIRAADGRSWVVPADAPASGSIDIRSARTAAPAVRPAAPATQPSPILIIPKSLLNRPPEDSLLLAVSEPGSR